MTENNKDVSVKCEKCKSLLGYIDYKVKNSFRIKYKDLYVFVVAPKLIQVTCRKCGEMHHLTFVE